MFTRINLFLLYYNMQGVPQIFDIISIKSNQTFVKLNEYLQIIYILCLL